MNDLPNRVVEAAVTQIGSPYVFGAWGEFCTPSARAKRARSDHPTIRSKCQVLNGSAPNCDGCNWQGDRMFDCRGFTAWCLKQADISITGGGCTTQYNTKANWMEKGGIREMPECVCCVFVADGEKKSHTGLYIGNGETIECSAGVQRKPFAKKWTHYAIPAGLYTPEEIAQIRAETPRPKSMIHKGDRGEEVRELQETLNARGYDCGTVDGIFGNKTLAAVKAFQRDNGLTPDGVVGTNTRAALETDGETVKRYAVRVGNLSKAQAEELIAQYPDAVYM